MDEPFTIRYASRRAEVWHWYLLAWRRRLWLTQTYCAAMVLAAVTVPALLANRPVRTSELTVAATLAAILIALMWLYPQIRFKPQERILTVGPEGVDTRIGSKTALRTWVQITDIQDTGGMIVLINRNQNAFVVPMRAFSSQTERSAFLESARRWKSAVP